MSFIFFYLYILIHPYIALWNKSFPLAGMQSSQALIPGLNYYLAFSTFNKKGWWALLLLIPGVHLVMLAVLNVSYIRRFGFYSLTDTLQGIIFPYLIFWKIAKEQKEIQAPTNWANAREVGIRTWGDHLVLFLALPVIGHAIALSIDAVTRHKPGTKTKVKEWGDSILFALIAALIIRTYVFEPFRIPTGSMERTLLVGDFLFVNKLAYGPKVPVTPLSYPLVHNTVPLVNIKSYTSLEKGEYFRIPGYSSIHRNDVVVFNYPAGDTAVYDPRMPFGLMGHEYEGIVYREAFRLYDNSSKQRGQKIVNFYRDSLSRVGITDDNTIMRYAEERYISEFLASRNQWNQAARKLIAEDKITFDQSENREISHKGIIYRPVDKRENYIKRCVAIPSDYIELKNSILYVNDQPAFVAPNQLLMYSISNPNFSTSEHLYQKYKIENSDIQQNQNGIVAVYANLELIARLRKDYPEVNFSLYLATPGTTAETGQMKASEKLAALDNFPKDSRILNTVSDFRKIQVPFKGKVVDFTKEDIAYYRRIITAYEGHTLEEKADGIYIDGKKTTTYTVGMNYYWMMGDNRYNSADSRVWGFVPEDHIIGKASMTWLSSNPQYGFRFERFFKPIK